MKILKVALQCLATHNAYIEVDDDCDLEHAIEIAQNQMDNIPADNLRYVEDSDQICEDECAFVTEEEKDIQNQLYRDKIYREVWKEHVKEDIREFLKDNDMELDEDGIDKAATLYVMHGQPIVRYIYQNVIKSIM